MDNKKTTSPLQTAIKIAIIVIVIIILLLISFAMIKLVPSVFSSISRFKSTLSFFGNKERMVSMVDKKSVSDRDNVLFSWKQERGNGEGEHVLNYPCDALDDDTHLQLTEAEGAIRSVFCDEDISLGQAGESDLRKITFTAFSDADEDQILHLTVSHVGATSTYASSTVSLTIKKNDVTATKPTTYATSTATTTRTAVPTKTVVTTQKPVTTVSSYKTLADLVPVFTKADINSNDFATIEFQVSNFGQTATGQWRFRAVLPQGNEDVVYESPYQSSIPAGKTSIMTLSFDNANAGRVEVTLDYYNQIQESNENNNKASVKIN